MLNNLQLVIGISASGNVDQVQNGRVRLLARRLKQNMTVILQTRLGIDNCASFNLKLGHATSRRRLGSLVRAIL